MKLRIRRAEAIDGPKRGPRFSGRDYRYWLDDMEITGGLTGLTLRMGAEEANSAMIGFLLDDVDIDADALAALEVAVEGKELEAAIAKARQRELDRAELARIERLPDVGVADVRGLRGADA